MIPSPFYCSHQRTTHDHNFALYNWGDDKHAYWMYYRMSYDNISRCSQGCIKLPKVAGYCVHACVMGG